MFDKNALNKLDKISDNDLKEKLANAIKASPSGSDISDFSKEDIGKLRSIVSALSQKDIDRLMASIPHEKIVEIKNKLSEQ